MHRLIVENTDVIIALQDQELVYKYVSPSITNILGYQPHEILNKTPKEIFGYSVNLNLSFPQKIIVPVKHKTIKSKKVILEISSKPLHTSSGKVESILTTSRDVTERESMINNLEEALYEEKEKNRFVLRLASAALHEFRNPLAIMMSSEEILAPLIEDVSASPLQEKLKVHLARITKQTHRLTEMINSSMFMRENVETITDIRFVPVPIRCFLEQLVLGMEESHGENFIRMVFPEEDRSVQSDPHWLSCIVKNLIENAVKFSGASNEIPVLLLVYKTNHFILKVADYGIGIPKEDQEFIFDFFYRASNVRQIPGTGLGLNIVKEFINRLGGNISFSSEEKLGSAFTIELPYER
ncbi:PAS domain-containing sensor histidine kinase [Litoribacter populi]|uniref:PAS domain-containing sensor histidine kinase n=1 Tax=Litoribacter populi TaxID=2598460 RepID=UPI001180D79F|nr:PAS domain-containing sensor histidine kinase [Litoribacter populi]